MSAGEFEGHEDLIAELRAGTLDAPSHLHRRVLALGQKRARVPRSPRQKAFILVPVAVGLALGAAVIHGALNSGPSLNGRAADGTLFRKLSAGEAHVARTGATPGSPRPVGTQGHTNLDATGTSYSAESRTALNDALSPMQGKQLQTQALLNGFAIPTNRLVHAEAQLEVVVPSHAALTRATNKATTIVTQLGGYAQNVTYAASRDGRGAALLTLRVPVGKAELAIQQLDALGQVASQQISTQDLEQKVTSQSNTIGTLQRDIRIYEQALASGTLTGSQQVEVQVRLSHAEHQLTHTRKARVGTLASGHTADIALRLTTHHTQALIVRPSKPGRFGRFLHNAGDFLAVEGLVVLYALLIVVPVALLLALGWLVVRERRRREEKLLANA